MPCHQIRGRGACRIVTTETPSSLESKEKAAFSFGMEVPEEDYEVPLGTVSIVRPGADITILANMLMVHHSLSAAEQLSAEGIEAEVVDVRCLVPLDIDALQESVAKTGRVVIVEEDHLTGGWGAEVAALLGERAFYHLDAPIKRVAAPDAPLPCAGALERAYVPSVERILNTVRTVMGKD